MEQTPLQDIAYHEFVFNRYPVAPSFTKAVKAGCLTFVQYPLVNCRIATPSVLKPFAVLKQPHGSRGRDAFGREEVKNKQTLWGIGSGGYRPVAFASNMHNEEMALRHRVLVATPPVDDNFVDECISFAKKNHSTIFPKIHKVRSVDWDTWINNSNASPMVKIGLRKDHESMKAGGFDENTRYSKAELSKYTLRKAFVKVENLTYTTPSREPVTNAPRLIMGATSRFNNTVGPWITGLQHRLKRRWNLLFPIKWSCGMSARGAATKLMEHIGRKLEDDISKFDSSVCVKFLQYERWLFKRLGAPRAVLDLCQANIKLKGVTTHGFRFKCPGTRKSGDPYTSLGNAVLNAVMHLFLLHKAYPNKTCVELLSMMVMLVCGDDNAMSVGGDKVVDWVRGMSRLGFKSKAIYRDKFWEMEFCSARLVPVRNGYTFVPKIGRVMAKLGYFINPPNEIPSSVVRGTALGIYTACSAVAPLRAYLDRLLSLTQGSREVMPINDEWKMSYEWCESTPETLCVINDIYFWDEQRQRLLEADLSRMQLEFDFTSPLVLGLYDMDTAGNRCIFTKT
jgi:hypothetical protein